ncbi:MAG: DUF4465 domain-containing protein [Flavipsychrobacter sp.]
MRSMLLSLSITAIALQTSAQTVGTFEDLTLPNTDTFYVNYSAPGTDVGFNEKFVHYPTMYDTGFGYSFLSYGFVYSDKTDSVTPGYTNPNSAITAKGYAGSNNYVVAYGSKIGLRLADTTQADSVLGFYITNNTYAYRSMLNGDGFSKKFGGPSGNDTDFFQLKVFGYQDGMKKSDSVLFYLADFHYTSPANHYIVKNWQWVDLSALGKVDSLAFLLSSSDTAGGFGMNTPAYFCIDNFTVNNERLAVANISTAPVAKVYPVPAVNDLYVALNDRTIKSLRVLDMQGRLIAEYKADNAVTTIDTRDLAAGMYILQFIGGAQSASMRFTKQ